MTTATAHTSPVLRARDFRINYTPMPARSVGSEGRHWMLDHKQGRELLVARLIKKHPQLQHKANTRLEQYDDELNYLIDEMGVRDCAYESDERGRAYKMMCVCGLLLKTVFGLI